MNLVRLAFKEMLQVPEKRSFIDPSSSIPFQLYKPLCVKIRVTKGQIQPILLETMLFWQLTRVLRYGFVV